MVEIDVKSKALILGITEQEMATSSRFLELIKACGIDVQVISYVPDVNQVKLFDFVLVDLSQIQFKGEVAERVLALTSNIDVVFFNADEANVSESSALLSGVKGIFYHQDRPNLIIKGIESIINQEPWFKRSTMSKAVTDLLKLQEKAQGKLTNSYADIDLPQLTKREKTIVHLVSSGAQNKEIAEQLHISPNTVKTHIYSLFRKTSSRNRIELITWSQQFNTAHAFNS